MTVKISHTAEIQKFFEQAAGLTNDQGSPRVKQLVLRIV
ncbi:catechol 1,2-dioxygenase, partial [Pseudomonas sp. CrR25]|nr:catechol 1,2-dioxygenase [Pseudomonas sp. CrR25]